MSEPVILVAQPFALSCEDLMRTAHVRPGTDDADAFASIVERVEAVAVPRALFLETDVDVRGDTEVAIGGTVFGSAALAHNLQGVGRAFAFVATCGPEADTVLILPGDALAEYWRDVVKAALLGHAMGVLHTHLQQRYGVGHLASMNPGSADAETWPIEQQRDLFDLLGDVRGAIGVVLTDSCLMVPNKTVSGLMFETDADWRSCQVCRREGCPGRSAPFDQALWEKLHQG